MDKEPLTKNPLFKRFVRYHTPYTGSILLAMAFAFVGAVCALGVLQLVLHDAVNALEAVSGNSFDEPVSVRYFQREGNEGMFAFDGFEVVLVDADDALKYFLWLLGGMLILVLIKGCFVYGNDYVIARVGHKLAFRLRNALYERIVSAPLGVLREERTGDLMTRITEDVRVWQTLVAAMAGIIRAVVLVVSFVSVMLIDSFKLTFFVLVLLPLLAYLITLVGRRIRSASIEIQQQSADIYSQLKETFSGIKIIKSFTSEQTETERFRTINWSQYCSAIRRARFAALLPPLIEWLGAIGIATVFGLCCWQVINGQLSIGWFIRYVGMVSYMFKPIKTIGNVNTALQQCLASAERIFYLLDFGAETGPQNSIDGRDLSTEKSTDRIELKNIRGTVTFQNVTFSYSQDSENRQAPSKPVIDNVTFEAKPGEVVALVGPSGSGKTTLLNLLLRFYEVNSGKILIDDVPISEVKLESLRQNIALVPQDTFLFDGTILENIGYGCPGATDAAIVAAAQKANAHEFITKTPNGYATPIGEAGVKLSGGEQQRLSIARALLKDAPILVLDEATSSLDTQSEALIQESLTNLMQGRTSFIIAHRLSTVVRADKILVIKDGEILETGTHQTLLAKGGLYKKFCEMQLS
ncbi:ABC transporter ATP-binding protein [Candidatus Poribacteria bacterium]|nr:ABC transporter ATP-binding protein [Candidatus Poribacteria bacterium]MYG07566.1 ABC transporter ATP-binding protein [Candidatus Poribacteria bacterium]MYK25218.1 ABC transporter ATP-binding protein [Candidatus Poribacteria bacterium]